MSRDEQPPQRFNPAATLEIPVMAPSGAALRGHAQRPVAGEIEERPPRDERRDERLERTRMSGQRPIQGIGEPTPFSPAVILNRSHELLEQYKKDASQIDPVYVQIMMLEALGTFGSKAAKVDQLTQEVARLRKAVETMGGEPERGKPKTRIERLRERRAANGRSNGGGLRGRFAARR